MMSSKAERPKPKVPPKPHDITSLYKKGVKDNKSSFSRHTNIGKDPRFRPIVPPKPLLNSEGRKVKSGHDFTNIQLLQCHKNKNDHKNEKGVSSNESWAKAVQADTKSTDASQLTSSASESFITKSNICENAGNSAVSGITDTPKFSKIAKGRKFDGQFPILPEKAAISELHMSLPDRTSTATEKEQTLDTESIKLDEVNDKNKDSKTEKAIPEATAQSICSSSPKESNIKIVNNVSLRNEDQYLDEVTDSHYTESGHVFKTEPLKAITDEYPPPLPSRKPIRSPDEKIFYIASFNFYPTHPGYLILLKGQTYEILDNVNNTTEWWMAKSRDGKKGLIPSKFVSKRPELDMYPWYYKDLTRHRCEYILREVGTDGGFLVRKSNGPNYFLSVFIDDPSGGRVYHYRIQNNRGCFYLRLNEQFVTIPDLLQYHTHRSGCLHTLLTSPPPIEFHESLEAHKLAEKNALSEKLEINRNDIEIVEKIGFGSFGEVHRGKFGGTDIAAEITKDVNYSKDVLLMEAKIMSQLSHPNIVQFYGIVSKSLPVMKVTELMQNGNLLRHLQQHKIGLLNDIDALTNMCRQVCLGMEYLHNRGYIHRNLAAKCCLVGMNRTVKVADFSQARYIRKEDTVTYTSYMFKWAPPEVLYSQTGDLKSDVWSYGVLMWEVFTCGEGPYSGMSDIDYKQRIRSKRYRLNKPIACSRNMYKVMHLCWAHEPSGRPTFRDLMTHLDESNLKQPNVIDDPESQSLSELGFNPRDKQLFMLALDEGQEPDNFIRVMVVGNYNQGKTSLTRRLLGLQLEGIDSTDGIDIHSANCNIDDITWTKTECQTSELNGAHRLARVIKQNRGSIQKTTPIVDEGSETDFLFNASQESDVCLVNEGKQEEEDISQAIKTYPEEQKGESKDSDEYSDSDKASLSSSSAYVCTDIEESIDSRSDSDITEVFSDAEPHVPIKDINLLARFLQRLKNENEADLPKAGESIPVNIWDFGGQFIYYATHQIFHSKGAIYLLVFDLTKDLDSIIKDDDFPDRNTDMRTSLKFWVESVHAFVGTEDGNEPKIILIGTHKADCASRSDIEQRFDEVLDLFINSKSRNHIYMKPFAIENTDPDEQCIAEIKQAILDIGSEKAKSSKVPAKWIQLEVALNGMRHTRKIVKFKDIVDLDASTDSPIKDEQQLKLFLKYHHAKGMLVYFDECRLGEFVVIDPQFLVDAFKCIITSKRFCKWESPDLHALWAKLMESAVLEKYLLNRVWENDKTNLFMEHRDILLAFLQRLKILAETLLVDEVNGDERGSGKYIVPSLLKAECSQTTLERVVQGKQCSLVILGLSLEDTTIIKTVYERVTAAALGRWPPLKLDGKTLVFQSTALYLLDLQHAGIISNASEKGIELVVISQCPPEPVEDVVCDRFRRFVEAVVTKEFQRLKTERQDKPFNYYIKCNHTVHGCKGSENAHFGLDNVKKKYRVCCPDNASHAIITKSALAEWFQGENIAKREKALQRKVTEKDLGKVAQAIGDKWELLGTTLGLSDVDIQRIKMDHTHCSEMAIYSMLMVWKKQNPRHDTMNDLTKAMKECHAVSVNWDNINNILDDF